MCRTSASRPLHFLFLLSLKKHTLPTDWCTHLITPVYKSGNKTSTNNYRPISLLCNTSKALEQLIYDKIYSHINKLISTSQFGFMRNRSSVQQILILLDTIINTEYQSDVIYLESWKAFDSISHNDLSPTMIC